MRILLLLVTVLIAVNLHGQRYPSSHDSVNLRLIVQSLAEDTSATEDFVMQFRDICGKVLENFDTEMPNKKIPLFLCDKDSLPDIDNILSFAVLRMLYNTKMRTFISAQEFEVAQSQSDSSILSCDNHSLFCWFGGNVLAPGYPSQGTNDITTYNHIGLRTSLGLIQSHGERVLPLLVNTLPYMRTLVDELLGEIVTQESDIDPITINIQHGRQIVYFVRTTLGKGTHIMNPDSSYSLVRHAIETNYALRYIKVKKGRGNYIRLKRGYKAVKKGTGSYVLQFKKVPFPLGTHFKITGGKYVKIETTDKGNYKRDRTREQAEKLAIKTNTRKQRDLSRLTNTSAVYIKPGANTYLQNDFYQKVIPFSKSLHETGMQLRISEAFPPTTDRHTTEAHFRATTIDCGIQGCSYNTSDVPKIVAFIQTAQSCGMKAVFETKDKRLYDQLLASGVKSEHIRLFTGHITGSHFSLYNVLNESPLTGR